MTSISAEEIAKLSVEERLELMEQIWASLDEEELPPPSDAQVREVERRLDLHKRGKLPSRPWNAVLSDLERKHQ